MGSERLTKAQRAEIRKMFDGRCAYCGEELGPHWHVDHVEPIIRGAWIGRPTERPDRHRDDNLFPACPRCNISKGSMSLEAWRVWIAGHLASLNRDSNIYRIVKSFGLVAETSAPVVFHFEAATRAALANGDTNADT